MKQTIASRWVAQFGPFEADLRAGQLRKNGRKVKLQDQPFQILVCLLERAGEVVTREELRQNLWPADTFTDFDHGLNNAINRLREALCDSADKPRYIETLPRRGYRFIAAVDIESGPAPPGIPPNGRLPNGGTAAPQDHLQGIHQQAPGDHGTPFDAATSLVSETLPRRGHRFIRSTQKDVAEDARKSETNLTSRSRFGKINVLVVVGAGFLVAVLGFIGWRITAVYMAHSTRTAPRLKGPASGSMHIVPLTTLSGFVRDPAFSPDGEKVAFF
jgi:DNA-binding winged helix-turn-helix (wHTH) protein